MFSIGVPSVKIRLLHGSWPKTVASVFWEKFS